MVVAASTGSPGLYDTLVALHVACALIGFGSVALSGLYGATARHPDREGSSEETRRYFRSAGRAEWLVLAVPFLGAGALGFRPSGAHLGDTWVIAAAGIWLVAAVLLLAVVRPAERRIRAGIPPGAGPDPPARPADREADGTTQEEPAAVGVRTAAGDAVEAGRLLMWGAIGCDLLFVAALVLMIGQPA